MKRPDNSVSTAPDTPTTRTEAIAIGLFLAFTIVALLGYAVFGRNPGLLASMPASSVRFYRVAFGFFAQAQIVVAALALFVILVRRSGWRWLSALVLVYLISLGSELGGTRFGIPFGAYSYRDLLGPKWFDLVPVLIPLSWFLMAVPSYALARRVTGSANGAGRVLVGSFILLAWDLSLDPAMSWVVRYWDWAEPGPYYGMPLHNLAGWYVTGVALMVALQKVRSWEWLDRIPLRLMAAYWGVNLLMPLGMNAAAGLAGAVLAGVAPIVLLCAIVVLRSRSRGGVGSPLTSRERATGLSS